MGEAHVPKVAGRPLVELPADLYIPPDALEVFLEAFEGPLDLLLYLIRKQNIDILDIPVLQITQQYMRYIALMEGLRFDLAAEYLVMAAWLAEIKSRVLLPRPPVVEDDEPEDPRAELVRRLQEYERFKTVAETIDALPRQARDFWLAHASAAVPDVEAEPPPLELRALLLAFHDVLARAEMYVHHAVTREPLSVRERMAHILERITAGPAPFAALCDPREGRAGIVVALLAILELAREGLLDVRQEPPFGALILASADAAAS
ncbi:MAG TPA: ScpA family protein [Nevskiaceae bacterium]